MAREHKETTVQIAARLVQPIVEERGLILWDVRYEKEGNGWYLRYFIDKEGGVDINDCEAVSKAVDPLLDEADPVSQSYTLEVCSPGLERSLIKDWHFQKYIGAPVMLRLIRPVEGIRDFKGTLLSKQEDEITIELEPELTMTVQKGEVAYIKLDDFEIGGNNR
ncbi:ribosome maturation factor RimP [Oscillospiraceae bacterium MB08-C2-2]|nr:ribosome maturation factor RimP [Oscillospiraceae bacterium MB08-C2-2]